MTIDIESFIRNHGGIVNGALKQAGIKKNDRDYEDLVQDGMVEVLQYLQKQQAEDCADIEKLKAYIYHQLVWYFKKKKQRTARRHELEQLACGKEQEIILEKPAIEDDMQFNAYLENLVQQLTREEQELVYELFILDLSIEQIGAKHHVSKFHIYKKRQKLREKLCTLDEDFLLIGQKGAKS